MPPVIYHISSLIHISMVHKIQGDLMFEGKFVLVLHINSINTRWSPIKHKSLKLFKQ